MSRDWVCGREEREREREGRYYKTLNSQWTDGMSAIIWKCHMLATSTLDECRMHMYTLYNMHSQISRDLVMFELWSSLYMWQLIR